MCLCSPRIWSKFVPASLAMKTYLMKVPIPIYHFIFANTYTKNQAPGQLFAFDARCQLAEILYETG